MPLSAGIMEGLVTEQCHHEITSAVLYPLHFFNVIVVFVLFYVQFDVPEGYNLKMKSCFYLGLELVISSIHNEKILICRYTFMF